MQTFNVFINIFRYFFDLKFLGKTNDNYFCWKNSQDFHKNFHRTLCNFTWSPRWRQARNIIHLFSRFMHPWSFIGKVYLFFSNVWNFFAWATALRIFKWYSNINDWWKAIFTFSNREKLTLTARGELSGPAWGVFVMFRTNCISEPVNIWFRQFFKTHVKVARKEIFIAQNCEQWKFTEILYNIPTRKIPLNMCWFSPLSRHEWIVIVVITFEENFTLAAFRINFIKR